MFIDQTRLRRTANLNTRQSITPIDIARFSGVVKTIPEAMSYLPAAQRPAEADWGGFDLLYDLKAHVFFDLRGVRPDTGRLIAFISCWQEPSQVTGPPLLYESMELTLQAGKNAVELRTEVVNWAQYVLREASLQGYSGDMRDRKLIDLASEIDPSGLFDKVKSLKDTTQTVNTSVSNPSSATLYPMVVQP